ncbi:hypothetical protein [Cellulosilyticum ruminicola]|uniref:hypothetical protein n=1 Tax=Cellulosilyticum ruminicola TaxID=425254 RepID=UPI0006CF25E0|nr:hypothetical protein [Cellulosilyticum ruminicola]
MEIGVGLILIVWLGALLRTQQKALKTYDGLETKKVISSGMEEGKMEQILRYGGIVILIGFVAVVMYGAATKAFNERIMLYLVAIYLVIYYMLEYISHHRWCMTKEGLRSSRQLELIGFEKVVNFTWYEKANGLILRVNYKGRGLVTRKSDYLVPSNKRKEVEKFLKEHVICTRG